MGLQMADQCEILARDEADVETARDAIWQALDVENGHVGVYAALCRWTWRIMLERRLDDELRSWHRLLLDAAGHMVGQAKVRPPAKGRVRLDPVAASERIRALADLVRMSVEAAAASVLRDFTARAHVVQILQLLASHDGPHLDRDQIKAELGLRDANLSRVLTLLAANGLVERIPRGRVAAFRVTQRGLALIPTGGGRERFVAKASLLPKLPKSVHEDVKASFFAPLNIVSAAPAKIGGRRIGRPGNAEDEHEEIYSPGAIRGQTGMVTVRSINARVLEQELVA